MAKRKSTIDIGDYSNEYVAPNLIENEEKIINDIIIPAIEDHLADTVKTLRSRGFDDNRIAAKLMINVDKIKSIK